METKIKQIFNKQYGKNSPGLENSLPLDDIRRFDGSSFYQGGGHSLCQNKKSKRRLLHSFKFAFSGLTYAFKTQPNLRIHGVLSVAVFSLALLLGASLTELAVLSVSMVLVIVMEIVNTALEVTLDIMNGSKFDPLVKIAKDVIASAVLLASVNAAVVGTIIFVKYISI